MNLGRLRIPGRFAVLLLLVLWPGLAPKAQARPVGQVMARIVASNWLTWAAKQQDSLGNASVPTLGEVRPVTSGARLLAHAFRVFPAGQIVVADNDDLTPILFVSEGTGYSLEPAQPTPEPGTPGPSQAALRLNQAGQWLRGLLLAASDAADSLALSSGRDPELRAAIREQWSLLGQDPAWFTTRLTDYAARFGPGFVPRLLASDWSQRPPYNDQTPRLSQNCTPPAGSSALALAQILRFHAFPERGTGLVTYDLPSGTDSGTGSVTLRRDFAESAYAWPDMPDRLDLAGPEKAREAVAELVVDAGLALRTQYGCEASGDDLSLAPEAVRQFFGYREQVALLDRALYDNGRAWAKRLTEEINAKRPVALRIEPKGAPGQAQGFTPGLAPGLTIVLDGLRDGPPLFHANMGLGPGSGAWLSPDLLLAGSPAASTVRQTALVGLEPPRLIPLLLSPAASAQTIEPAPFFSWKPAQDGDYTHYNLWIGRKKDSLVMDWMETGTACADGVCTARPSVPFEAVGNVTWAVRGGRQNTGPGPWSEIRTLVVAAPPAPQALAPHGPQGNLTARLFWKETPGAVAYRLHVALLNGTVAYEAWHQPEKVCDSRNCSLILPGLPPGNATWQVQALGAVPGPASPPLAFALLKPALAAPGLMIPGPGRVVLSPPVRYAWTGMANATSYHLFVTEAGGRKVHENFYEAANFCARGNCSAQPGQPLPRPGLYFWKMRAVGPLGPGPWSPTGNFTFSPTEPPKPGQRNSAPAPAPGPSPGNARMPDIIAHLPGNPLPESAA